jgi:phosphoesterase RecJ-like protein
MIKLFKSLIEDAETIVITTHIQPDADGIGSEIALCYALRSLGKNAICVNEKKLLDRYLYLDPKNLIYSHEEYQELINEGKFPQSVDLFIVTDTNTLSRIGNLVQKIVTRAENLLFIDHHPAPKELAAIHCIDTNMAATGELVGNLIESIDVPFTKEMALAMYTAILIDTSSFRYPTVTANTHRLIGKLMDTGVEPPEAYNRIYGTKKVDYMKMLGLVLSNICATDNGQVGWMRITEADLEKYNVDSEDTHGLINHLLILDNIKVALMFRQIDNKVKISFRSAGDIDVGVMAQALGGGGHDHSAATVIEGELTSVIDKTIPKIELMLSRVMS